MNPGGPGGPGAAFAAMAGRALQRLVDTGDASKEATANSTDRFHDVISFDPRGIGWSTPGAWCFDSDEYRWIWLMRIFEEGIPGSSNAAVGRLLSMQRSWGDTCNNRTVWEEKNIMNYISTTSVARDMLAMVDKHDEWLTKEKGRLSRAWSRIYATQPLNSETETDQEPRKPLLNYWGFSYGTLLGNVFASMFPDRTGHLVLDGVLEPRDFIDLHWAGSIEDTEAAMSSFYTGCAAAGPSCDLAWEGCSAADVRERFQTILTKLYHNPLPLQQYYGPEVMSYSMVKSIIFASLYTPVIMFGVLARIMKLIEEGDIGKLSGVYPMFSPYHRMQVAKTEDPPRVIVNDAGPAIECSDVDSMLDIDIDSWQATSREMNGVSATGGGLLTGLHMRCAGWNTTNHRFTGPFGGDTAGKILWIGNTADPICPIKR